MDQHPIFQRLSSHLVQVTLRDARQTERSSRVLRLKLGEAFPPTHPTSRLCLDLLREVLAGGGAPDLLDVGCGAGVLSLAAAALGVPKVVAVDLDARAVLETRENARENLLDSHISVVQGSTECLRGVFYVVAANLPIEVQMAKAPELSRLAAPAGALILSGFRDNQENPLQEAYQSLGWGLRRRLVKDFRHPELPAHLSFTWVAWILKRT
jgi:ribosomal protein L11 methyltransferase